MLKTKHYAGKVHDLL